LQYSKREFAKNCSRSRSNEHQITVILFSVNQILA
jgi:hypothetical protein